MNHVIDSVIRMLTALPFELFRGVDLSGLFAYQRVGVCWFHSRPPVISIL